MHFSSSLVAAVLSLAAFVHADDGVLPTNYPNNCPNICGPVVTASQSCGLKGTDCICDYNDMKKLIPKCDACSSIQNGPVDEKFARAISDLRQTCGFDENTNTQKYNAAAPTGVPVFGFGAMAAVAAYAAM